MTYQSRTFPAKLEELENVKAFILERVEEIASSKIACQLDMIIEELFVNIASYSYPEGDGTADIGYCIENDMLYMSFSDEGIPFDPLKKPDAVAPQTIEDAKIGGLGILMVKKKSDSLSYSRENGKNTLLVSKSLKE